MRVCHFTSAHDSDDIRVFVKECVTLASNGFEVYFVAPGPSREDQGVKVVGIGDVPEGRLKRMTGFAKTAYKKALELNCDVYHFHDPELLPYGLKLKKKGKTVIYDSHEDVPAQIMDKKWIPAFMRKMVSSWFRSYETRIIRRLDAVVCATPYIAEKMQGRANKIAVVNNFPKLDDIVYHESPFASREGYICYAGNISEDRGDTIMNDVMREVDGRLIIAGEHDAVKNGNVEYIGKQNRTGVNELYKESVLGLCILKPIDNYLNSQPIKMYEYMAAGLPFVCSDFPKWRKVAEESGAGVLTDPADISGTAKLLNSLLGDKDHLQEMGRKGRQYVISNCSWENEGKKLTALYNGFSVGEVTA